MDNRNSKRNGIVIIMNSVAIFAALFVLFLMGSVVRVGAPRL